MKKVIRLTESDLVRIVKRVIKEQAPTDVYNPSSMGRVSNEPSMGRAKSNEFDWKSHFDQIKNELDSYLNTIEGPVDVKRFQSKVMNTYYRMVSNVDDEYSYPSHGRDFQQLTTDFMSYFTNKLKELIQNYGKLTESDLIRIVNRVIKKQTSESQPTDIEDLSELFEKRVNPSNALDGSYSINYFDNGKKIGGVKGSVFQNYLTLEYINIDEKYRDLGYSKFMYKDALELAKKQGQLGLLVGGQLTTPFKSKATYKNFIQQELSQKNERGEPITVLTKWLGVQPSNSVKEGKNNPNRVI